MVVAVEVPHKLSECPIVMGGTGSEQPVEGLWNRLRAGLGFPSIAIEMFGGGLDLLPPSLGRRD